MNFFNKKIFFEFILNRMTLLKAHKSKKKKIDI